MSQQLIPYNEHQKRKQEQYDEMLRPKDNEPSGIACPNCGEELRADYSVTLTSMPPKHTAWCRNKKCGWNGYI